MTDRDFVTRTLRGTVDGLNLRLDDAQARQAILEAELALVNNEITDLQESVAAVKKAIAERVDAKAAADLVTPPVIERVR